jgi:hypothetical protein
MRTNYNPQGRLGDPQTIENVILSFEPRRMLHNACAFFAQGNATTLAQLQKHFTARHSDARGNPRSRSRVPLTISGRGPVHDPFT